MNILLCGLWSKQCLVVKTYDITDCHQYHTCVGLAVTDNILPLKSQYSYAIENILVLNLWELLYDFFVLKSFSMIRASLTYTLQRPIYINSFCSAISKTMFFAS